MNPWLHWFRALALLAFPVFFGPPPPLQGQAGGHLVPGARVEGSTGSQGEASYRFSAASAGVLTVVARSLDGSDLVLILADADGQLLPNGRSDQDLGGDPGAEQFAYTLSRAGDYRVGVSSFGADPSKFLLGVAWLPFPELAMPPDPDGSPGAATVIGVGQPVRMDTINGPAGDAWDWFRLKVEKGGILTVATQADEGDLILEAYKPGSFAEPLERSDQDLQGSGGNEALTLVVSAGQELFFRVSAFSEGAVVSYRLRVGLIPD